MARAIAPTLRTMSTTDNVNRPADASAEEQAPKFKIFLNGKEEEFEPENTPEPDTPLLWVLREQLGLTGTKYGCGIAQCGACTVHIDDAPVRSCVIPIASIAPEQKITTIEGLSRNGTHQVQRAWQMLDVPQCGFCQSGMIMAAAALLRQNPNPSDADINAAITNICRCGSYNRVRLAIRVASQVRTRRTPLPQDNAAPKGNAQ